MDPEKSSQSVSIPEENVVPDQRKKRITFVVNVILYIVSFIGQVVTIALGVPMIGHCYIVAVVVMIIGPVLGILQVKYQFLRKIFPSA